MINCRWVVNVVIMGAQDAAFGAHDVLGKEVGILSVVTVMSIIHFSLKSSTTKFMRVDGVASIFFFNGSSATDKITSPFLFVYSTVQV